MFLNKAQNLKNLSKFDINNVEIPKFLYFNVSEWKKDKDQLVKQIKKKLQNRICIRSSYYSEDSSKSSLAGKFDSFINIKNDKKSIVYAVENLIRQYLKFDKKKLNFGKNYLLVQNFVQNSICSGVITNYTLGDGAPYFTINYNDISKSTLSVTSGDKDSFRVLYVSKKTTKNIRSNKFKKIIEAIKKIEKVYDYKPLDIEFALNKQLKVFILQIRPISTSFKWKYIDQSKFNNLLIKTEKKYKKIILRNKKYGKKGLFGLMPDWNPAEIIGFQPNLFSYSLYKHLVTDKIWSIARNKMGYKELKNPKLMYSFTGKPYIDLRMSFNSFLPRDLNSKIQKKVTKYWIDQLIKKPFFHDKIEFEITENCFYFGLDKKINKYYTFLKKSEKKELYGSLKELTNNILEKYSSDFNKMNNEIISLEHYRVKIIKNYLKQNKNEINLSKKLLKKCKNLGLIPFSMQARNAFISKKILNSLVDSKILSKSSYFNILSKLKTISHDYISDKKKLKNKKINKNNFNKKYFHLRPNSYDILNKRYDETIKINKLDKDELNLLLNFKINNFDNLITKGEYKKLNLILKKNKISIDVKNLLSFFIGSLKLRENYKFIFTRSLSDSIELLRKYSKKLNFYNKISNIDLKDIFKIKVKSDLNNLNLIYKENLVNSEYFNFVKLPYLIVSNNDFFVSSILLSKPNFITDKNISGELIFLDGKFKKTKLKNKIVVIENADPGFDWIFSHKIKGLITKFGGVNSHMSIRCEELNLPAIIGFGEDNYSKILNKKFVNINCKLEKFNIGDLKQID
tara:strand:+ start:1001 stop:3388 length:2388 start_codon:yes stop_codon:yes gene_type:complete